MLKEYVLLLCTRYEKSEYSEPQVLLINKDRPAWQKGRLNLPGGRIEEGETPVQAAIRELMEETGLKVGYVKPMGVMSDREFTIHCLSGEPWPQDPLKPRNGETEVPEWMDLGSALRDKRLIPNLRTIIPMMMCGVTGWVISDCADSVGGPAHKFSIIVPTYN
jgi:8-oxo-dGTP pyrophosphatase MutT (NUDIX family)